MIDSRPDPDRTGGIGWLERTHGALTRQQRLQLVPALLAGHRDLLVSQARLLAGRRPQDRAQVELPEPPDSALAQAAVAVAAEVLAESLVAHSARTWWYGQVLADLDGVGVDRELAFVAALLHDVGLAAAVPGEDFTGRGARRAQALLLEFGVGRDDARDVADAISVHTQPGIGVTGDGALGTYLQAGAMLDLVGLRADSVPRATIDQVLALHPRGDLTDRLTRAIRAEADAVPGGRFALLRWAGLVPAIRLART